MAECRPKNYPKLKDYKPSRFMLPTCHYDAAKADRAVTFIENLRHTKGKWAGKRFWLLPWQEQIIRDVFGIVDERGNRQFRTAYVEIGKKNGKSELAAAVALYLLFADNEPSAEVYGAAADRQQASIVFDVAHQMVQMTPALLKRCKIMAATKRIVNYGNAGFYQVLSAEVGTKHGLNVSGLVLDEVHAQPNRKLYDVLTKGSGDAREQPLFFLITTAGTDKESICYELHMKALDLLAGRKIDYTFYPVVYGLTDEDDWHDEANWYKANPSLGQTIQIQRVRDAYQEALDNPAEENVFKQLRLNMWVSSLTRFIPEHIYNLGSQPIDMEALKGRDCYGGLDLSSTGDITAFVLMFPPRTSEEKYIMLPFFWIPEDTIPQRVRRASVPYDVWYQQGYLMATEGNVIHYGFIEKVIEELGKTYHILEIAFDRWGAVQMTQNLEGMGWLYSNVSDIKNLVGDELVASAIKSAMAELGPNEVTNRTKIEPLAQQKLAESLVQKYGDDVVFVNKVVINDMNFEDAYNEAIQQKSIAQQNADKQKIENEAAIAKAEADKQVAITNAEAEAQKTSIAADAQAEANRKLAESLSDTLIDYQKIQKWDGKLPTVSGGNALVSIDPAE